MSLKRIQQAVRAGSYQFTTHALEEMDADNLVEEEARGILLRGRLTETLTNDPRGMRFVVRGTPAGEDREVEVVCRFLPSGLLRIITAYEVED